MDTDLDFGKWMQTWTGRSFYPLSPRTNDIDIEDIAHALSLLCRYNGHTKDLYSVAEHSYLMSKVVSEELALEALLHDAHEAYLGDMPGMIKPEFKRYVYAEDNLDIHIRSKFGLPIEMSPEVKEADLRMLVTEKPQVLRNNGHKEWTAVIEGIEPYKDITINFYYPKEMKELFLKRFKELY